VNAQKQCNHVLYDRGCTVARAGFKVTTTANASGTTLTLAGIGGNPNGWAKHGDVVRVSDGERRSILEQVGTTVTIDVPFGTFVNGDSVEVYAGCDWLVETCVTKFANVANFGGHPEMPTNNPTAPTGYGVISQA
jgi:uncharacterized phage protein (TIGR02218 family)